MSHPTSSPTADTGEPAFKRRRVALACRSCRNRKARCDGAKPACKLCIELGFDCVYKQPVKAGGSGVRTSQDSYEERLRAVEQTLQMLVRERDTAAAPVARASSQLRQVAGSSEHVTVLDVLPDERGGDAPVDGLVTVADLDSSEGTFFGPSSNVSFIRELSSAITTRACKMRSAPGASGAGDHAILSRATSPQGPRSPSMSPGVVDVRILPPEQHVTRLIELFFHDTGLLFPFVCKQHVLEAYSAAKGTGFRGVSRPLLCLLNVIFAFATYISVHPETASEADANDAEVFFQRARKLVHDHELHPPSLLLVQALLLMCLYRQGSQVVDDPWQLHCLAFRSAMQLGLHSSSFSEGLSTLDIEIRKRVWFGCVSIDRILAMSYGRPPAIPETYIKLDLPLDCSLETLIGRRMPTPALLAGGASTASSFIYSASLYRILYDILEKMYGFNLDSTHSASLEDMRSYVFSRMVQLSSFEQTIPVELRLRPWEKWPRPASIDAEFRRLSVIMRLRILHATLLLYRPMLTRLLERGNATPDVPEYDMAADRAGSCVVSSQVAAIEIIEIAYALRSRPSILGAFWFAAYYTFTAALSILACLMLEIDRGFDYPPFGELSWGELFTERMSMLSIKEKGKALRSAIDVVECLGGNTKSARRIRKTLVKIVKTCQVLCSDNADVSRAFTEGLGFTEGGERTEERRETRLCSRMDDAADMETDPSGIMEVGVSPMWADLNCDDIFGDMMTFDEVGFTAL